MYIYRIVQKSTGRGYIGKRTLTPEESKDYFGSGVHIKRAIQKYGRQDFRKEILYSGITDIRVLDELEKKCIAKYDTIRNGFNISIGGTGGNLGQEVNKQISDSVKLAWSNGAYDHVDWSAIDRGPCSNETKKKISDSQSGSNAYWYGQSLSEDHKQKISEGTKEWYDDQDNLESFHRIVRSNEHRERLSQSHKGQIPWNKGKSDIYSDETLRKMAASARSRNISKETKDRMRKELSKRMTENHPGAKSIFDTRTGILYPSVKAFCDDTGISWYVSKKLRKNGTIREGVKL